MSRSHVRWTTLLCLAACTQLSEPLDGRTIRQLDVGAFHTCGVLDDGALVCWGSNDHGALGMPGRNATRPARVDIVSVVARQVAAGTSQTCALLKEGSVVCWGDRTAPTLIDTPRFSEISAGSFFCGRTAQGAVWCWRSASDSVVRTPGGPYTVVAAGAEACGLDADSLAFCWGTPGGAIAPLAGGLRLASIALGSTHGCGIDGSGAAYCWGQNFAGQLGDGTLTDRATPTPVKPAVLPKPVFARVSAHGTSSCAIDVNGRAFCWGNNSDGQLGRGFPPQPGDYYAYAVAVVGGITWRTLTDGSGGHVCGLSVSGEAYCWGANNFGQVGIGTRDPVPAPTRVRP